MITMEANGMTWVEDIFQKFEAMCLEVEEVVCEDTVKYVENQVQTVGATFKKLYSEAIQDLLPPSIDLIELPSADLALHQSGVFGAYETPEASINVPMCGEINNHRSCNQKSRKSHHENVGDMGGDIRVGQAFSKDDFRSSVSIADGSIENPTDMTLLVESCEAKETELRSNYSVDGRVRVSADLNGMCETSGGVFPEELNAGGDPLNEDDGSSCRGLSAEWNLDFIDHRGSVELGLDAIKQFDHLKLEETCIMVDRDQIHLNAKGEDKPRSYKKKIREAFSSKGSARKHEYEQLAVQYENMETGSNHVVVMSTLLGDADTSNLPAHDFCESEWELL